MNAKGREPRVPLKTTAPLGCSPKVRATFHPRGKPVFCLEPGDGEARGHVDAQGFDFPAERGRRK